MGRQGGNSAPNLASNPRDPQGDHMANDENDEIDLLRSVFALAHERRPPLSRRIAEAI